jgi:hypothetical protein
MNPDTTQGQIRYMIGSLIQNALLIFVLQHTSHGVCATVSKSIRPLSIQVNAEIFVQLDANTI